MSIDKRCNVNVSEHGVIKSFVLFLLKDKLSATLDKNFMVKKFCYIYVAMNNKNFCCSLDLFQTPVPCGCMALKHAIFGCVCWSCFKVNFSILATHTHKSYGNSFILTTLILKSQLDTSNLISRKFQFFGK